MPDLQGQACNPDSVPSRLVAVVDAIGRHLRSSSAATLLSSLNPFPTFLGSASELPGEDHLVVGIGSSSGAVSAFHGAREET